MRKLLVLALCGLFAQGSYAQNQQPRCATVQLQEMFLQAHPELATQFQNNMQANEELINAYAQRQQLNSQMRTTATVHTIPVVFHIVLNSAQQTQLGGSTGIRNRVISQIKATAEDFLAQNADSTKIPSAFKPLFGNSEIKFAIAHTAPDGSATDGYEIITTTATGFDINPTGSHGSGFGCSDAKYTNTGVSRAWDPTKYLNVWVVRILDGTTSASILGLTIPPGMFPGVPPEEYGVVLNYGAFGKRAGITDYYISGIDRGRTLTHELGHYLNLRHIWGDENACANDDGVADTPPQGEATFGCEVFPFTDACSPSGNGIMFMNYMDYVNDICMYMFTKGQVNRMRAQVDGGPSTTLTQNPHLANWPTAVSNLEQTSGFNVWPNPTNGDVQVSFTGNAKSLKQITVTNMMGQQVLQVPATSATSYTLNLASMSKGVYFVQCSFDAGTLVRKIVLQ